MRHFLIAALIGQLAVSTVPAPAGAKGRSYNFGKNYFFRKADQTWKESAGLRVRLGDSASEIRARRSRVERAREIGSSAFTGTVSSHAGQLSIMLYVLTLTEATRQKAEDRAVRNQDLSFTDMVSLTKHSANELVNSFELWSAILGASAVNRVVSAPLAALRQTVNNRVSSRFFSNLINSGIGSFITFVGWEAGAQLWEESIDLLGDEEMIREAQGLRFAELMAGGGTTRQKQVFGKVLENAWYILSFGDPKVTKQWWANTWRLKIATGDFVVLVSSMVLAGAAAGSIVPGAGTLVGACFGLAGGIVGGLLAMYVVPESVKRDIDDGIKASRRAYNQTQLSAARRDLLWAARTNSQRVNSMQLLRQATHRHSAALAKYLTTYAEQYYAAQTRIMEIQLKLELVNLNHPAQNNRSGSSVLPSLRRILGTAVGITMGMPALGTLFSIGTGNGPSGAQLRQRYTEQLTFLKHRRRQIEVRMFNTYTQERRALSQLHNDSHVKSKPNFIATLQGYEEQLYMEQDATYLMFAGLNPEQNPLREHHQLTENELAALPSAANIHLNASYLHGYHL